MQGRDIFNLRSFFLIAPNPVPFWICYLTPGCSRSIENWKKFIAFAIKCSVSIAPCQLRGFHWSFSQLNPARTAIHQRMKQQAATRKAGLRGSLSASEPWQSNVKHEATAMHLTKLLPHDVHEGEPAPAQNAVFEGIPKMPPEKRSRCWSGPASRS